ncbi:hypothetical protein ACKVEX_16410 [Rhodocyclaceae bacterium SMB388]
MIRAFFMLLVCGLVLLTAVSQANAFWGSVHKFVPKLHPFVRSPLALPDAEIVRLSKLADEVRGTEKLGIELGKRNLPNDVLEDTFLRIALHKETLPRAEAKGMFANLTGVPGFRTTLRKIIGNSEVGTVGHLYELRLANEAVDRGFSVRAIGEKFSDGLKRGPTDIDVILERGGRVVAIEAKHYGAYSRMPLDMYRADLDTLVAFRASGKGNVMPVFTISSKPVDEAYLRMLKLEAARRDVELVFGDAGSSIAQIRQLVDIR